MRYRTASKLTTAHYKYVEHELYNYNNNLEHLQELEEEIVERSPNPSGDRVQSSEISDSTSSKAIKLTTTARLITLRRNIKAIERSLQILKCSSEPKKYLLVEMKYLNPVYADKKIASELFISPETYYRWRREFIDLVALHMGLV